MEFKSINLTTIILEAIKILGPALIASLVSIKISKNQYKMRIEELKGESEYKARENIYKLYREKISVLRESNKQFQEVFQKIFEIAKNHESIPDYLKGVIKMMNYGKEPFFDYIEQIEEELKKLNLYNSKNQALISSAIDLLETDVDKLTDEQIFEFYMKFSSIVNRFFTLENNLLEKKSNELFAKYLC